MKNKPMSEKFKPDAVVSLGFDEAFPIVEC